MYRIFVCLLACLIVGTADAASKPHVVILGQWQTIPWFPTRSQNKPAALKIRGLYIDNKLKEHTTGPARDITNHLFVVRRVFQLNDALPDEKQPRWRWELGAWISVDRSTGRITELRLPEFGASGSAVSWYRDYAAYCGTSEDTKKLYGIVVQLGKRKPIVRELLEKTGPGSNSTCPAPTWERDPAQVTFKTSGGQSMTFAVGPHEPEVASDDQSETAE